MRHRHTAALATAAALLLLTACGSDGDTKSDAKATTAKPAATTPTKAAPASTTPAPATTPKTPGSTGSKPAAALVGTPDAATQAKYIAELTAIDPAIVANKIDRAVSRGRDQCTSVKEWPNDHPKLVTLTEQRFTTTNGPLGQTKAEKVLAAVRKHICPQY
ncbi:hypothetical protein [Embleya sp. AB8]|uniref:hypothetical protein n=1 Tax=Embleya sp. AB8 TaxID=3156304 RepID=UPI003C70EF99